MSKRRQSKAGMTPLPSLIRAGALECAATDLSTSSSRKAA